MVARRSEAGIFVELGAFLCVTCDTLLIFVLGYKHATPYWFLYLAIKQQKNRSRYNTKHLQKWLSQNGTIFNGTGGKHYSHNASQVMCTAILTSWDSRELTIIRLMCGISSSLSLVGCIFIITAYILRPELHKKLGLQLILTLSIAGIVDASLVF